MADAYEISRQTLYLVIVVAVILACIFTALGFVIGQYVKVPESFPTAQTIEEQVSTVRYEEEIPETIQELPKIAADSSTSPHVQDEGMTFYEKMVPRPPTPTPARSQRQPQAGPVPTVKPGSGKVFVIQVASVHESAFAEEMVANLKKEGYPVFVEEKVFKNKRINYRVRVGPYATRDQAVEVQRELQKKERMSPMIYEVAGGSE